jgi:hypothetical protein
MAVLLLLQSQHPAGDQQANRTRSMSLASIACLSCPISAKTTPLRIAVTCGSAERSRPRNPTPPSPAGSPARTHPCSRPGVCTRRSLRRVAWCTPDSSPRRSSASSSMRRRSRTVPILRTLRPPAVCRRSSPRTLFPIHRCSWWAAMVARQRRTAALSTRYGRRSSRPHEGHRFPMDRARDTRSSTRAR